MPTVLVESTSSRYTPCVQLIQCAPTKPSYRHVEKEMTICSLFFSKHRSTHCFAPITLRALLKSTQNFRNETQIMTVFFALNYASVSQMCSGTIRLPVIKAETGCSRSMSRTHHTQLCPRRLQSASPTSTKKSLRAHTHHSRSAPRPQIDAPSSPREVDPHAHSVQPLLHLSHGPTPKSQNHPATHRVHSLQGIGAASTIRTTQCCLASCLTLCPALVTHRNS